MKEAKEVKEVRFGGRLVDGLGERRINTEGTELSGEGAEEETNEAHETLARPTRDGYWDHSSWPIATVVYARETN